MTRTPDEIKKGLECCQDYQSCTKYDETQCPYYEVKGCVDTLLADALALIQQLESDKQQLEGMLTHMNQLRDAAAGRALKMEERVHQLEAELEDMTARYKIADDCAKKKGEMNETLYAELTAVKAERDAAVADLKYVAVCETCKEFHRSALTEPCLHCTKYGLLDSENKYEWRGVQKEGEL